MIVRLNVITPDFDRTIFVKGYQILTSASASRGGRPTTNTKFF